MAKKLVAGTLLVSAGLTLGLRAQPLPGILELDHAIEIALSRHADLDAARAAIEARTGSTRQAALSPNPVLSLQTENWRFYGNPGFSAARDLDLFAWVSVPIETAGKRTRRIELAEADERIAEYERQLAAWRIRQSVKKAYWNALATVSDVKMLERSRETLERLEDYHEVRVRLGATAEVDLIKVRVEVGRSELALSGAEMEVSRAKIAVLEAMGIAELSTGFELQQPDAWPVDLSWDNADATRLTAEKALAHRVEILLGQAQVERARAAVELQRSLARPDVRPYVGYKRTNEFNTLIGGISIPLPVRDDNAGRIGQALAEVRRREAALRAAEARISAQVATAVETVRRRSEMLRSMETGVLDRARETSRIALAAYQEGGLELLDVLDAQRAQNELDLFHSRLVFDYQLSWVDLETASGTPNLLLPADGAQTAAQFGRMVE
ncbi:MAG: TolC family protein [Candidatus Aminicenantes bacterium]|nr:TolC family protein [Candidatus Aminicenantes bacterium]